MPLDRQLTEALLKDWIAEQLVLCLHMLVLRTLFLCLLLARLDHLPKLTLQRLLIIQ
jgi:hypothetical protein